MFSMTGYGRGRYENGGLEVTAEIKTVNNRYLDVSVKSPRILVAYEEIIRSQIREKLTRGHADVFISVTDKRERVRELYIDMDAARAYVGCARAIKEAFPDLKDDFTVTSLMRQSDVVRQEETDCADDELITAVKSALGEALTKLNAMREVEGKKLSDDMLARVDRVEELVKGVKERAPLVAEEYKTRLREKIEQYLESVPLDEGRLLTEVAVFSDKSNIDEELTRLGSHISQFRTIAKERLVGRKLDFLVQEFNRETNTICSKSNDLTVTKLGLELKNEIEKIREQVQNVE